MSVGPTKGSIETVFAIFGKIKHIFEKKTNILTKCRGLGVFLFYKRTVVRKKG